MSHVDITALSKLKHADLFRAAQKMGGQSALARHLGIQPSELGEWCNLKKTPPKSWSDDRLIDIEIKLHALTGKTLEEIFPPELKEAKRFLKANKTFETTRRIEVDGLLEFAGRQDARICDASEGAIRNELRDDLRKSLSTLSNREQSVLSMRFGLDGDSPMTLEETANSCRVTKERIRQIEAKAIRKLRQPSRSSFLVHHAE